MFTISDKIYFVFSLPIVYFFLCLITWQAKSSDQALIRFRILELQLIPSKVTVCLSLVFSVLQILTLLIPNTVSGGNQTTFMFVILIFIKIFMIEPFA